MRILFRVFALIAMVIAALFVLVYIISIVGLWLANAPTKTALTSALTVSDELLLEVVGVMEQTDDVLLEISQLGQDIGASMDDLNQQPDIDPNVLEPVQNAIDSFNNTVAGWGNNLNELRTSAEATEQTIAQTIPRIPTYINLVWLAATLLILWLALAQASLFYLALLYLRKGNLGWTSQPPVLTAAKTTREIG